MGTNALPVEVATRDNKPFIVFDSEIGLTVNKVFCTLLTLSKLFFNLSLIRNVMVMQ